MVIECRISWWWVRSHFKEPLNDLLSSRLDCNHHHEIHQLLISHWKYHSHHPQERLTHTWMRIIVDHLLFCVLWIFFSLHFKWIPSTLTLLGSDNISIGGYSPASNGVCVRSGGAIKQILRSIASDDTDWDLYLPLSVALNNASLLSYT